MSGIDDEEQERGEQDEVDTTLQSGGPARDHGEDADRNVTASSTIWVGPTGDQ